MRTEIALVAASAALAAAGASPLVTADSGGAVVINNCATPVPITAVPATTAGVYNAEQTTSILAPNGGTFQMPWIKLDDAIQGGWSIKVNPLNDMSNIYQWEYTYGPDLTQVWLDLSIVNGNANTLPPYKLNCPINGVNACHQDAYLFSTDDKNGMQAIQPTSLYATLLVCTPGSGSASAPATATTPAPVNTPTSTPQSSSSAPPASASTEAPTVNNKAVAANNANVAAQIFTPTSSSPAPVPTTSAAVATTLATQGKAVVEASPTDDGPLDVQIVYETKIVTAIVTETAVAHNSKHKRHVHGHRHF